MQSVYSLRTHGARDELQSARGASVKPPPFEYHAPEQVDDVLQLLDGDDMREVRVLAGGQSLVPVMNFRLARPDALVDIRRVDALRHVTCGADGSLVIGAGARQSDVLRTPEVARGWPLLADGIRHIGHPQIRNRGTVCGSLAHADPSAELPAVALAYDARLTLASVRGRRELTAADFFVSYFETALEPDELLLEVTVPAAAEATGWSFLEIARRRGDFAIVGAAVLLQRARDGAIRNPRIVVFGAGARPLRCLEGEKLLEDRAPDPQVGKRLAALVAEAIDPLDDVHASADYRREAAGTLAWRATLQSWERAAS